MLVKATYLMILRTSGFLDKRMVTQQQFHCSGVEDSSRLTRQLIFLKPIIFTWNGSLLLHSPRTTRYASHDHCLLRVPWCLPFLMPNLCRDGHLGSPLLLNDHPSGFYNTLWRWGWDFSSLICFFILRCALGRWGLGNRSCEGCWQAGIEAKGRKTKEMGEINSGIINQAKKIKSTQAISNSMQRSQVQTTSEKDNFCM